jgi:hypothetical protein
LRCSQSPATIYDHLPSDLRRRQVIDDILHTVSIFGDPVYRYSYREALIDGLNLWTFAPTEQRDFI